MINHLLLASTRIFLVLFKTLAVFETLFSAADGFLAKLSKKYGVAIKSTGGVIFGDILEIEYSNDETSGDLYLEILHLDE